MSAPPPTLEELDAELAALDRVEEAIVTLLNLKAGDVLTEQVVADLLFLDEYHRNDAETAVDTFHRGYETGLQRGAGADTAKLIEERDSARTSASVANAVSTSFAHRAFVEGAQACREMMARFVEQDGSSFGRNVAASIRANWRHTWGEDPGVPDEEKYASAAPCEISAKPVQS